MRASAHFVRSPVLHRRQYAFIGGGTIVTQDVLPFSLTSSRRENKAFGINKIGLERRGFTPERLSALQKAFRLLLASE